MDTRTFKIEFTNKEITPWGGMILMKKLLEKTGIQTTLLTLPLPTQGSNRGYDPIQLILMFFVSVWCGANRFEHLEVTRYDEVIRKIFGWKRMAGHKAFTRYFRKFSHAINQRVFHELFQWFFHQLQFDNYTLDLDSTVSTRYGEQEGAAVGYNPKKRGRKSHHSLGAFVAESRMVVNYWLRPGNTSATNNIFSFCCDTLSRLRGKKIGLVRADSGFHDQAIFTYLEKEEHHIPYIIAMRFHAPIKRLIASLKTWTALDTGIEITETTYQASSWLAPRRLVVVRQHIPDRPKATGKQLRLFEEEGIYKNYRYSCFITSLTLPPHTVWVLYRGRSDAENRFKELKYDFGTDSFNLHDFYATEAALQWVMMAYNFMSLFRQAVLQSKVQPTLKTLRYKVFAISAYLSRDGNTHILKLSLAMKRREWFTGLWKSFDVFAMPVQMAPG
jgi:hypothetical protein